ncbi:hypothetical protein Droror1_Dr00014595 [Drosera rotundifolia]
MFRAFWRRNPKRGLIVCTTPNRLHHSPLLHHSKPPPRRLPYSPHTRSVDRRRIGGQIWLLWIEIENL